MMTIIPKSTSTIAPQKSQAARSRGCCHFCIHATLSSGSQVAGCFLPNLAGGEVCGVIPKHGTDVLAMQGMDIERG